MNIDRSSIKNRAGKMRGGEGMYMWDISIHIELQIHQW